MINLSKLSTVANAICALAISASILHTPAHATGLIAGATEPTQIANNMELAMSLIQQTRSVAEQITSRVTLIKQYTTMVQNLKNMPSDVIQQTLAPYREQLAAFDQLKGSVNDLRNAAEGTRAMFSSRGMDFNSSGMNMSDYLKYELALAAKKGGIYKKRMNDDFKAMDTLREKASALRATAARTNAITGNVEGLQQLSQLSAMQAGELMEIKSALIAASADRNMDKAGKEEDKTQKATTFNGASTEATRRATRNDSTTFTTPGLFNAPVSSQ
jgi:type IV secretion system protein TrbJ